MKPDFWFWMDLLTEFAWNAATAMTGYITATKVLALPDPAAWLVAALMGVIGTSNHIRALRKRP
jgi:hypothetical protein